MVKNEKWIQLVIVKNSISSLPCSVRGMCFMAHLVAHIPFGLDASRVESTVVK